MRGAIAAGHPLTAEAGARVLAEGGNAVDACIAAGFASWVTECSFSGPGAGGFMLVHRAGERGARVLDFFASRPGKGLPPGQTAGMVPLELDYDGSGSELFLIGAGSCAVPGNVAGLAAAHRAYGSLPWPELTVPAFELARDGFELTPAQGYLHRVVDGILRHTEEGRGVYGGAGGERLVAGDRIVLPGLASTLERLAERGADDFYRGELAREISRFVRDEGGLLTLDDLAEYRVIRRRPIRVEYLGHEFVSNPPPSSGGLLVGYGLRLLERLGPAGPAGSTESLAQLAEVMRETTRVRGGGFAAGLRRGGAAGRLYSGESLDAAEIRVRAHLPGLVETGPRGTTHISVVDGRGNAASMTASNGAGSGMIVPGTGVHLNNMLGEHDLNPAGPGAPGRRLTSMMSPSIVLRDGRPRLVVGSAGSVRLRNAVLQIVANVLEHGDGVREAIERPRIHVQEPQVHCEGGHDPDALDRLESLGYDVVRWKRLNLYFGGAGGVEFLDDGSLAAAGDPRRGGHGIVVE